MKKITQIIQESKDFNFEEANLTIGEYIEKIYDENIRGIVTQYLTNIDSDVRLAVAINSLPDEIQKQLMDAIGETLYDDETDNETDIDIINNPEINESVNINLAGWNIFKSFVKCSDAIPKYKQNDVENNDILIRFTTDEIDVEILTSVLNRYEYFKLYTTNIQYTENISGLFIYITTDMVVKYGIFNEAQEINMGDFTLNVRNYKILLTLDSISIYEIKKVLTNLQLNGIISYCKIKKELSKFKPFDYKFIYGPLITNNYSLLVKYKGYGQWQNDRLSDTDFNNIKNIVKSYFKNFKWTNTIKIKTFVDDYNICLEFTNDFM